MAQNFQYGCKSMRNKVKPRPKSFHCVQPVILAVQETCHQSQWRMWLVTLVNLGRFHIQKQDRIPDRKESFTENIVDGIVYFFSNEAKKQQIFQWLLACLEFWKTKLR